jgi:ribonuclease HI
MNEDPSPKLWLFAMMESLSRDDFARVAVTMWAIWYARRKIIHDEVYQSPLSTHLFIQNYLRDLSVTSTSMNLGKSGVQLKHPRWIAPCSGCVKINVDAAVAKTGRGGAVGAVCRDEAGLFLGASSLTIKGISDPTVLEALACREAMALAADLNLQRVTVATDCLAVVNNIKQDYAGSYSMIIEEVKADARGLQRASFRHENRASNSEAHCLARLAVSSSLGRQVWLQIMFMINKVPRFSLKKKLTFVYLGTVDIRPMWVWNKMWYIHHFPIKLWLMI